MGSVGAGIVAKDHTYADVFSVFHKNAPSQLEQIFGWLNRNISSLTKDARAKSTLGTFRVLSVGCGKGQYDLQIAKILSQSCSKVEYVGVDINAELGCSFMKKFQDAPDNVECEFKHSDIQKFLSESQNKDTKYDLVFMCHIMYYIQDREAVVRKAVELLNPQGGKLIIVNQSPAGVNMLQKLFIERVGNDLSQTFSSCDMESVLLDVELQFEAEVLGLAYVNVTECVKSPISDEGLALMSFFLEKDLRSCEAQQTHREAIKECAQFLDFSSSSRKLRDGTIQRLMFHPVTIFTVGPAL